MTVSEKRFNAIKETYKRGRPEQIDFEWDAKNTTTHRLVYQADTRSFAMGPEVNLSGNYQLGMRVVDRMFSESISVPEFISESDFDKLVLQVLDKWEERVEKIRNDNKVVIDYQDVNAIMNNLHLPKAFIKDFIGKRPGCIYRVTKIGSYIIMDVQHSEEGKTSWEDRIMEYDINPINGGIASTATRALIAIKEGISNYEKE